MARLRTKLIRWLSKGISFEGDVTGVLRGSATPEGYSPSAAAGYAGSSSVVAACITQWTIEYPAPSFMVYDQDDKPVYDHPLLELLAQPAAWCDESEFKTLKAFFQLLTGTAYGHVVRNNKGVPIGIDLYHGMNLKPKTTKTNYLDHYVATVGGSQYRLEASDVIRFPWFMRDGANPLLGISPLQSAFGAIATTMQVEGFVREFLENGAVPGTLIMDPDGMNRTDDERKAIKQSYKDQFGSGQRGGVAYLPGKMDIKAFAHGIKDLEIATLRSTPEADICAAFRVPAELIGVKVGLDSSSYSNREEARKIFTRNTLSSMWANDARTIGRALLPVYGDSTYTLRFDTSTLPAMREDSDKVAERSTKLFQANVITRDEARAENGYEPVDNASVFAVDLAPKAAIAKGMAAAKSVGDNSAAEAYYTDLWQKKEAVAEGHRRKLGEDIGKAMTTLHKRVLAFYKPAKREPKTDPLEIEQLRKLFLEGTQKTRETMVDDFVRRAVEEAGFDPAEIVEAVERALNDGLEVSEAKMSESVDTIRREIAEVIATASSDELELKLRSVFNTQLSRIGTMARTTTTASNARSANRAWKELNAARSDGKRITMRWLSERDGEVRSTHRSADGQITEVDGLFRIGDDAMMGPGLGSLPEENINCRCVLVPVTIKENV